MKKALQVGTAGWAGTWVPFYEKSAEWKLAGVVSRSSEALAAFHKKHGDDIVGYTDYAEALAGDFDAVIISAPHSVHVPLAIQAIEAGKPVLIEKPLSDSFSSALELAEVARRASACVMVSQNFRYREPLWQLRDACRDLGTVSTLQVEMIQVYTDDLKKVAQKNRVSSLLEEVFIHQADQARFILGSNPVRVYAQAWNDAWDETGQANSADVLVEFENGARFNYHGSWSARGGKTTWAGNWRLRSQHGIAAWNGGDHDGFSVQYVSGIDALNKEIVGYPGYDRVGVLREFSSALDEHREPACSLEDNLWSFGIVSAALQSIELGRPVEMKEIMG